MTGFLGKLKYLLQSDAPVAALQHTISASLRENPVETARQIYTVLEFYRKQNAVAQRLHRALARINDPQTLSMLEPLLTHSDSGVRMVATLWLGLSRDVRFADSLLKRAYHDTNIAVRQKAQITSTILLVKAGRFSELFSLIQENPVSVAIGLGVLARRKELPPKGFKVLAMLRYHPELCNNGRMRRQINLMLRKARNSLGRDFQDWHNAL